MTTLAALAAIIAVCVLLGILFAPSYGTYRCCSGQALQSAESEADKGQGAAEKAADREGGAI